MLRMASVYSGDEDASQHGQREPGGKQPAQAPQGGELPSSEVRLQMFTSPELEHALHAIEPLPGHKRIEIIINNVSARVPMLVQKPSLLQQLNPVAAARRLGRSLPSRAVGGSGVGSKPSHRQVLFNVSGSVQPGEVLAFMGPSGSGKTTLLSIIGARAQKLMRTEGEVLFNGHPLTKRLKRSVGYVLQDDLLYEALTVRETLYYAAMLRLPRSMSREAKMARVDAVITALGLQQCSGTIIGGFFRKGISGGERKRTSIGAELLIDPSALLLDEPTSGLDATTSMHVLTLLRHLASGGRCVVATIHQPSSRLYQQLDKLLLLSQGHVLYYGGAEAAAAWFGQLGYALPWGVSLADFLLDLASGEVALADRDGEQSRVHLIAAAEAYLQGHPHAGYTGGHVASGELQQVSLAPAGGKGRLGAEDSAARLADSAAAYSDAESSSAGGGPAAVLSIEGGAGSDKGGPPGDTPAALQTDHRWGAPYLTQIELLFRRSLRTRRFQTWSTQDLFQVSAISLLAGLFWLQTGQESTIVGVRNTLGLLFFLLMFTSFRALYNSLFVFPDEFKHMLKERSSGMYRLSAFYFARTLSDVPMDFLLPMLQVTVVYFMGGLRYDAGAFFGQLGTALLAMMVAQSIGLLLGSITMVPKTAQTLATVIMLIMILTGGFFVTNLPAWISWLKYTSFVYYALQIMLFIQYDGGSAPIYSCTDPTAADVCAPTSPANPETNPDSKPVDDLQGALSLTQDPSSQGRCVLSALLLLAMLLGFRVAVYVVLRHKTSRM